MGKFWSEKLTWAFDSRELKRKLIAAYCDDLVKVSLLEPMVMLSENELIVTYGGALVIMSMVMLR